jgi:MinD-like ATPase involved in chromosome partitioning or flagellar assembly
VVPAPAADPASSATGNEETSRDRELSEHGPDLIAVSGAIAPQTAIKSPEVPALEVPALEVPALEVPALEVLALEVPDKVTDRSAPDADMFPDSGAIATETGDKPQTPASPEEAQPADEVTVPHVVSGAPEAVGSPTVVKAKAVEAVEETKDRAIPSIERALSGPSRDRNLTWHGKVRVVTGTAQGPGARDQEALDRARARLPLRAPKRVLMLGCTSGAGQTVTTLMTGHIIASLREQPVAAVDLNDGALARYNAPAAWLSEIMDGKAPQRRPLASADGLPPHNRDSQARLDVIASADPLADGDEKKLAEHLGRHYQLTMLDSGANGLTRLLHIANQLVVVVPASMEAAAALADTRDWLDAHGFADLAANSVTLINGVSKRSLVDVEHAESVARGRCRAIVRVPWDDMLPVGVTGPSTLRPQTRVAYTALAGVLVAGMAAAPVRMPR